MKFIDILLRIRNLLLRPGEEWSVIATESKNRKTIFVQFVLPLLCMITVAVIIGTWLVTSREKYSFDYVIGKIIALFCSLTSGLYFSSFLVTEITARQTDVKDHDKVFALMAYSSGAAYLVIMTVELFPFFRELIVLALYSCYLYWRGIPYLTQAQGQNRSVFAILSFVIAAPVYMLMFYFFGNVLKAIFA